MKRLYEHPRTLISALALTGMLASGAWAQSPTAPATGGGSAGLVAVQDFSLNGAGCPDKSATKVTLEDGMAGGSTLRIQFSGNGAAPTMPGATPAPTAGPAPAGPAPLGPGAPTPGAPGSPAPAGPGADPFAPGAMPTATPTAAPAPGSSASTPAASFRAAGPAGTAVCTVAVQLMTGAGAPAQGVDFTIGRAVESVSFQNPNNQGQLTVRSQFRVNNRMSNAATSQVRAAAQAAAGQEQKQDITINNVNVRAGAARQISLMANLQLQVRGAGAQSMLRLDQVALDLTVRGERPNDPDGD